MFLFTFADVKSLPSPQKVPPPVAVPPIREKWSSESTCTTTTTTTSSFGKQAGEI